MFDCFCKYKLEPTAWFIDKLTKRHSIANWKILKWQGKYCCYANQTVQGNGHISLETWMHLSSIFLISKLFSESIRNSCIYARHIVFPRYSDHSHYHYHFLICHSAQRMLQAHHLKQPQHHPPRHLHLLLLLRQLLSLQLHLCIMCTVKLRCMDVVPTTKLQQRDPTSTDARHHNNRNRNHSPNHSKNHSLLPHRLLILQVLTKEIKWSKAYQ